MIMSEYKLTTLIHFIGEKKLKQVGLLTCNTCVHILGDVLDVQIEGSSISTHQIENILDEHITDNPVADTSLSTQDQISLIDNDAEAVDNDMPLTQYMPSLIPVHIPEEASLHYDPLGIGYSYYPVKKIPPYTIICSECGRLYTPQLSFHSLQPIPALLTAAQQEVLKGFYIDIIL